MLSKAPAVLCILALICLFAVGTAKADTVNITNPDFEPSSTAIVSSCGVNCVGTSGPITGWSVTNGGNWAIESPYFTTALPPSNNALYLNGGTATQDLGIAVVPNATYTLSVYVGNRSDNYPSTYSFGLLDGSAILASTPVLSDGAASIPLGAFALQTFTFTTDSTVAPSHLGVFISDSGIQSSFTDVSLTVATPEPSSLLMLGIGLIGLLFLSKRFGLKRPEQLTAAN